MMENNIFKDAKFGDHFLTRNGTEVIYWGWKIPVDKDYKWHFLISSTTDVALFCTDDGLAVGNHTDFPEWDEDIVVKCPDKIQQFKDWLFEEFDNNAYDSLGDVINKWDSIFNYKEYE